MAGQRATLASTRDRMDFNCASASTGNVIWYSESGVRPNTLVRFDPKTEKFQSWIIPSGGGVVRHMMGTPDGDVLLACSGVNRVALVEVK